MQQMMAHTCSIGTKEDGSKSLEDRSPCILRTWFLSSIILSISASDIKRGPFACPLKTKDLINLGMDLYVSRIELNTKASVTRAASLVTKALRSSLSGLNNSFRTGCKASLAENSLSFRPWTSRFSSLFHLRWTRSTDIQVHLC